MTRKIETSVYGREDKKLTKAVIIYSILFLIVEAFIVYFAVTTLSALAFVSMVILFYVFLIKTENMFKTFVYPKLKDTKYVIRKVTTNLGKEYLSVFKESYEGRYSHKSNIQKKSICALFKQKRK